MDPVEHRNLVLAIYDAAADPHKWEDVLDRIAVAVNAHGCIIWEKQFDGPGVELRAHFKSSEYDRARLDDYIKRNANAEINEQEMLRRVAFGTDAVELVNERDLFKTDADYFGQPHIKELLERGIRHRSGVFLDKDNHFRSRFSIQRGPEQGHFEGEEQELLLSLLPHVAKALDLGVQMNCGRIENSALFSVIEQLNVGVCIIDGARNVLRNNRLFDAHRERFPVFRFDNHRRLALHEAEHGRIFHDLLADSLNHGRFGARPRKEAIIAAAPDGDGMLCVEVAPLHHMEEIGSLPVEGAVVITRDTSQPIQVDTALVQRTFVLTDAESALIDLVCDGLTNAQIAERRERSVETINTQVKAILSKSRTENRTQLVRMLCNFAAPQALVGIA